MNISTSDVNAGAQKAEAFVDETAGAIKRGTSAAADETKKAIQATSEKIDKAVDTTNRKVRAATKTQHHAGDLISEIFGLGARYIAESLQHRRVQVQQLTGQSLQKTTNYVQRQPLRAILIAAGAGVVLATLLAGRSRRAGDRQQ